MRRVGFGNFVGQENYLCSYCGGIIGKLPELRVNLPAGIFFEDMEGKVSYFHPICALEFASDLNRAVSEYLGKQQG